MRVRDSHHHRISTNPKKKKKSSHQFPHPQLNFQSDNLPKDTQSSFSPNSIHKLTENYWSFSNKKFKFWSERFKY